jgi:hypothetical protein
MSYHSGPFEMALGAAAGDDAALRVELRQALAESVARQADLLRRSRCDGNWRVAAERLRSIAASFHVVELVELAEQARDGAPGDPGVVARVAAFAEDLAQAA